MSVSTDPPSRRVATLLADDHPVVRLGLRSLLERTQEFEVVAEADTIEGVHRQLGTRKTDLLLLDLCMPGGSSLDAISCLHERHPGTRIVVVTMERSEVIAMAALRRGASGYVLKDTLESELLHALRTVLAGHAYLTPQLGAQLALSPPTAASTPDELTAQELRVLELVIQGYTNTQIGGLLGRSPRTIEGHRARIQRKTAVRGRSALIRYARERALFDT